MPRSQPYDPSFSMDLGDGYLMNPRSGEIFDSSTNTAYASPDELGMSVQSQMQSSQAESQAAGPGAGAAGGALGLGTAGYGAYSMLGSGPVGSVAGGAVPAVPELVGATYAGSPATAGGSGLATMLGGGAGTSTGLLAGGLAAGAAIGALQGKGVLDAVKGDRMNFGTQAALALPTGGLSFAYNPIRKMFGSKHAGDRKARSAGRDVLNPDDGENYGLADGSKFNVADFRKNTGDHAFNIDWAKDVNADQVALADVLTNATFGGNKKLRGDLAGETYNAWNSNGKFDENARAKFDALGGRDAIYGAITQKWKDSGGKMTAQERDSSLAALDKFYGVANPTGAKWEDGAGLSANELSRNSKELSKIPKAPKAPAATTKPLPLSTMQGNPNGGRPAPTPTFRPGATVNPNFKNQPYKIPKKK